MIVKLLTENHLEFLSLKGGCRGSSESTLVKIPHCWKSHVTAHICFSQCAYSFSFPILIQGTEKQVTEHVLNDLNRHLEMVTVFASQMDLKNLQITNKLQVRC